jgi:hypothetical protein
MVRKILLESMMRRFLQSRCGNSGVEFALLLPLLMLLLFGAIEIGRALHDYHVINETVRDAARYLSRVPATCPAAGVGVGFLTDDPDTGLTAAQNEARARALAMTGNLSTASPAPDLLGYWNYPADSGTVSIRVDCINNAASSLEGLYEGILNVPHVILTADVPFTFMFGELIAPDAAINITLSHNVVSVGL